MSKASEKAAAEQAEREQNHVDAVELPADEVTSQSGIQKRAPGFPRESDLTTEQVIVRRTDGEWPPDGRFYRVFRIEPVVSSQPGQTVAQDWTLPEHEAMHEANKLAVLQDALNRGLHPQEEARFDGAQDTGGTELVYSVSVIPATSDERAAATVTPSAALSAHGGTSAPDKGH
jgi:hypothetical protein